MAARPHLCSTAVRFTGRHSIDRYVAWHGIRRHSHAVGERDRPTKCIAGAFGKDAACPPHLQIQPRTSQGPGRSSTTSAVAVRTDTASAHALQSPAEQQAARWQSGPDAGGMLLNGEAKPAAEPASGTHSDQVS